MSFAVQPGWGPEWADWEERSSREDLAPSRGGWGDPLVRERPATVWSFRLLLAFLFLLYANVPLIFPALAPLAPAQTVAVAGLGVLFLERTLARRGFVLVWPDGYLLLAFLGVATMSSFTALWMRHSVEQTLVLAKFVAIYLLIVNTVESWGRLRRVLAVMAIAGLFPALGTLRNAWIGNLVEGDRAGWTGIFANPNDLAYALVVLFPLGLAIAIGARGWRKLAMLAILATFATAIFLSYSRGGLLGFLVVLGLSFLAWSPRWARLPGLVAGAVAVGFVLTSYWGRGEGFSDLMADATMQQRLDTVEAALAMLADRPLLGVGLGCSALGWPLYADPGVATEGWLHSHNTFAQVLSETGLLGAVPFLLLLGLSLWRSHHVARAWRRAGHRERARLAGAVGIALWGFLACGLAGGHVLSWFPYLLLGLASAAWTLPMPHPDPLPLAGEAGPSFPSTVRDFRSYDPGEAS